MSIRHSGRAFRSTRDSRNNIAKRVAKGRSSVALLVITALCVIPVLGSGVPRRTERELANQLLHGPGMTNHPVGVVPSANIHIPSGWPLDGAGAITCSTCHAGIPSLAAGSHDAKLRGSSEFGVEGVEFCARCHASGGQSDRGSIHWMALGKAHLRVSGDERQTRYSVLDSASRRCLGCHDGINAPEALGGAKLAGHSGSMAGRDSHPIGVSYSSHRNRRQPSVRLRPVSLLPPSVQLPGGRVSCISCHNLYAPGPDHLTIPIEGSALCFTCHQLD